MPGMGGWSMRGKYTGSETEGWTYHAIASNGKNTVTATGYSKKKALAKIRAGRKIRRKITSRK